MSLARAYERRDALVPGAKGTPYKGSSRVTMAAGSTGTAPQKSTTTNKPRFKRLSPEELATKRANGECYHCPEKYSVDHKCNTKGVFLIQLDADMDEEDVTEDLGISLHALTGINIGDTMKLQVTINGSMLVALVDSGSTHTFIREAVASQIGLQVAPRSGLSVKVANGDRVTSKGVCPKQLVSIEDEEFDLNCYILPLAGFGVILGVQWLRSLGPILWNFRALSMEFWRHGRTVRWTGVGAPAPQCAALSESRELLTALLDSYTDIFDEPRGLPPPRRHDHRIRLLPGTPPVAVRPYRYPQLLKDEIERQCDDMLQQGIIRECTSAYSSPILLVKKADKSWHFCVNYREINSKTVKDKFPIPVVDELLDELRGACFFTKLDLRSGYH
jgi:hypothetical protein